MKPCFRLPERWGPDHRMELRRAAQSYPLVSGAQRLPTAILLLRGNGATIFEVTPTRK